MKWAVDLINEFGNDDGVQVCATWAEADEFRRSYVTPHRHAPTGWERHAFIKEADPHARLGYHDRAPYLSSLVQPDEQDESQCIGCVGLYHRPECLEWVLPY